MVIIAAVKRKQGCSGNIKRKLIFKVSVVLGVEFLIELRGEI